MTSRLIEQWLPIAELGIESLRERRSMTALPPVYYLHVWWARRPLVAARAAILASLLPADADRQKFMHVLGIHGDPVAARVRIERATREGVRLGADAYGYSRAFGYTPDRTEREWMRELFTYSTGTASPAVLDPTAGGGSIPFEAIRLGLPAFANDLNPVATLILKATVEWPVAYGQELVEEFTRIGEQFVSEVRARLAGVFPEEPESGCRPDGYLWARTITCPYCDGRIPLSPNWRLAPDGTGVKLLPGESPRVCGFVIVRSAKEQSQATVTGGDAKCPWADCGRIVDGDEVKRQAQAGRMGEQLFTVVFKRRIETRTKTGKIREKWERGYRAPRPEDDNSEFVATKLAEKLPEWEALDLIPSEAIGEPSNYDRGHKMYGMTRWRDLFSPRQLLCHGTGSEIFASLFQGQTRVEAGAASAYLASALDKLRDYNSRMTRWHGIREVVVNTFDSHNFAMRWSYVEMAPLVTGLGYDWAIEQTAKCIQELIELTRGAASSAFISRGGLLDKMEADPDDAEAPPVAPPPVTITCQSADSLTHLDDGCIDCVVIDPPYYDNVMYAELSDFFYVWLKRTAGRVFPELFRRQLTDKENEAVANAAKFGDQKGAKALAARDYQQRMAAIFAECRRVLKPDGIMTLMFTHKATGAWDALASGLMDAGFTITASWPINTEAEGSLHIKDKSAANSTIFLVCRPRAEREQGEEAVYWETVEPRVAAAVRDRVGKHQEAGIGGVDLYLSCFGPALEEFARHWPLRRGQPRPETVKKKRGQQAMFAEPLDPYAVTPEDALDAARREVKRWRLEQILRTTRQPELDPLTEWFVLAWDAFKAPEFPYDEALRLARVVGLDLDAQVVGHVAEKKGSDLLLWDSARRAARGSMGPADGSAAAIDALHHVALRTRQQGLQAGRDMVERGGFDKDSAFAEALTAVLEVLPVSKTFTRVPDEAGPVAEAASDFDALEHLRRLMFTDRVPEPQQLKIWTEHEA
jgi:adenine-specific DNA methylase